MERQNRVDWLLTQNEHNAGLAGLPSLERDRERYGRNWGPKTSSSVAGRIAVGEIAKQAPSFLASKI